jgi:hypothetical protein
MTAFLWFMLVLSVINIIGKLFLVPDADDPLWPILGCGINIGILIWVVILLSR